MTLALLTTLTLTLLPCLTLGASIQVQVGANGGLDYTPSFITATDGDTVPVTPKKHSITQISFVSPCAPLAGGFDTGIILLPSGSTTKTYTIPPSTGPPDSSSPAPKQRTPARHGACVTVTNTLGSHDPSTASGSVFSAASVQGSATGSASAADVATSTASVPTGGACTGAGSAGSADHTGAKTGGAVKTTAGVRNAALAVGADFFIFNFVAFV
ncbi:hypothetical protein CVT25_015778 [Psilocybe cyanescens]|uniref:Uncharacterized protein n=1 Tax=Psilocybe cyanescens TaxID=93625 RepID=A0A409XG85_PSICY|nr:hypothetical protein CVT25_015778 [Psilocybe cyanescens]